MERTLSGKTVFITGGSRGIGRAIALRCAREGANVAIAAKTVEPHPKLPGTIHSVAGEIEAAGGRALPLVLDVRDEAAVQQAVERAVETFGGIDVLVNNASAISMSGTLATPVRRYDLMNQVNGRGTFVCSRACVPFLRASANPHVLTLSPPLNLDPRWLAPHLAYTISKYSMSLCTVGMAEEFRADGIAVNSLWPRTTILTSAVETFFPEAVSGSRTPAIMADAARAILVRDSRTCSGNFFLDEDVLRAEGVDDFSRYAVNPGEELVSDLFLERAPEHTREERR